MSTIIRREQGSLLMKHPDRPRVKNPAPGERWGGAELAYWST